MVVELLDCNAKEILEILDMDEPKFIRCDTRELITQLSAVDHLERGDAYVLIGSMHRFTMFRNKSKEILLDYLESEESIDEIDPWSLSYLPKELREMGEKHVNSLGKKFRETVEDFGYSKTAISDVKIILKGMNVQEEHFIRIYRTYMTFEKCFNMPANLLTLLNEILRTYTISTSKFVDMLNTFKEIGLKRDEITGKVTVDTHLTSKRTSYYTT